MTEKILIDGQEHETEVNPVTLLLHKDVMKIEVPNRLEVNPTTTLAEVRSLDQKKWEHLSTGEIFQFLFSRVFPRKDQEDNIHNLPEVPIPAQLEDLLNGDLGVQHISGLIVIAMTQGGILGKELFFKMPETYLYPAYQAGLGDLFIVLPKIIEFLQGGDAKPKPPVPPTPMEGWLTN